MRVAVIQPSYAPWLGYFWMMKNVDLFIYYNNVQYDKNGWRNRNRVLVDGATKWLTLSIRKETLDSRLDKRDLRKIELFNENQFAEHRRLLGIYYRKAPYLFLLDNIYQESLSKFLLLSEAVIIHTEAIANLIGVRSKRLISDQIVEWEDCNLKFTGTPEQRKNQKLLRLLKSVGCTTYLTGLAARNYLDISLFTENGIDIEWNCYAGQQDNLSVLHYLVAGGLEDVLCLLE